MFCFYFLASSGPSARLKGVSQVIYISDPRPGFELETSGELLNNSDSWAPSPDLLSLKFWEWGRNLYCEKLFR